MKRFFLFFLLLVTPHLCQGKSSNKQSAPHRLSSQKEPATVLLAYRRSGSHWLTYCLYQLATSYRIDYNAQFPALKSIPRMPAQPGATAVFYRDHSPGEFYKNWGRLFSAHADRYILLLRDYKECFPRQNPEVPVLKLVEKAPSYFKNLELYHKWPSDRRYLVYYEDLVENLEATLEGVLHFLGEPVDAIPEFLAKLDEHKKFVLNAYEERGGPVSKGADIHYHAKKMDSKLMRQIDEQVMTRYPHLAPYLERYLSK